MAKLLPIRRHGRHGVSATFDMQTIGTHEVLISFSGGFEMLRSGGDEEGIRQVLCDYFQYVFVREPRVLVKTDQHSVLRR